MTAPHRTTAQVEADKIDLELDRCARRAYEAGWEDVTQAIDTARGLVRRHMHPRDVEDTA